MFCVVFGFITSTLFHLRLVVWHYVVSFCFITSLFCGIASRIQYQKQQQVVVDSVIYIHVGFIHAMFYYVPLVIILCVMSVCFGLLLQIRLPIQIQEGGRYGEHFRIPYLLLLLLLGLRLLPLLLTRELLPLLLLPLDL